VHVTLYVFFYDWNVLVIILNVTTIFGSMKTTHLRVHACEWHTL